MNTRSDNLEPPLRWLIDQPLPGPVNMARDEALLECVGRGESPPTLRFYAWSPATVSLGYFQSFSEYASLPPPAGNLAVVRRLTGGGAILHDQELTYSLTLPLNHSLLRAGGANALYEHVHAAVAGLLRRHGITITRGPAGSGGCSHRGPFFCFERHSCFDLIVGGAKIMGSAQRRTARAVLQHGSLILDRRYNQQQCAAVREFAPLDIRDHLGELAEVIGGGRVHAGDSLSPRERDLARQLEAKYRDPAWLQRR